MIERSAPWFVLALLLLSPIAATAGEPVAGIDLGAAVAAKKFRQTVDPGGSVAPYFGYRFGEGIAIGLIAQPEIALFPTDDRAEPDDNLTAVLSVTAGPRVSIRSGSAEVYAGAQGGVYTGVEGAVNDTAAGFNVSGGFNYDLTPGASIGAFARKHEAYIDARSNTNSNMEYITAGVNFQYRFVQPAPVVAQAPPPPPPAPEPTPAPKKKIVLRGVNFDFDKHNIRSDARPTLDAAAATLKEYGSIAIAVDGHTDSRGTDAYNENLSRRRAEAVRDYLAAQGIDSSRMTVEGFGESRPVATNDTEEGRAENRRVELRVTSGD